MIRFLLDQELVELSAIEPDLTVLDWLRIHRQRTGTKEGCGSGDCGACTVVVATPTGSVETAFGLHYKAINSCITFVGTLHGKQLLTVESLASGDCLHPVQQCMVEQHGSQCGFCTPGFVMSLYALYQQDELVDVLKHRVEQALGGNLCRCTGYRPIKLAAEKALEMRSAETNELTCRPGSSEDELQTITRLQELVSKPLDMPGFLQPGTLQELATLLQQNPTARLLAGGTDLALEVTQQMRVLPCIVSLSGVPELNVIECTESHMTLGAAVTLAECLTVMQSRIPGARELLLRFGSDQVRNQGTIGGNIGSASPIGDLPPMLIALNATLVLRLGDSEREILLESHFLGYRKTSLQPGEFIKSVRIPLPCADSIFSVHKVSKRKDDDISSVCMAIHLAISDDVIRYARIAFGGMAAVPIRARKAEVALKGKALAQSAISDAQQALSEELEPIDDARASAAYRMTIAQNLLQRVLLEVKAA
jgi:xanthine dehydrogenase small subunit